MHSVFICSTFLLITIAHCAPVNDDSSWSLFKQVHKRNYNSIEEELHRRSIWETNLAKIRQHNLEADIGIHSYRLGMNAFGDLTHEEFRAKYLSNVRVVETAMINSENNNELADLPESIDWRQYDYVTPIKNEGSCGACYAFSATGALEGQHAKVHKKLVSLSEQNIIDCSDSFGNAGCNGGYMSNAFAYVVANGLDTEASYPYTGRADQCHFNPKTVGVRSSGYVNITAGSEVELQKAIANIGPIAVAVDASDGTFQMYQSGVYNNPKCSSTYLDFAGLVVGYGTLGKDDYYIFKNIWGTDWGEKGYMLLSRNKNNQCGVASLASYPIVI